MEIKICDICGTRESVSRRQYPYDRRPDGAGGSETVCEIFDLCQTHELVALKRAIKVSYGLDIKYDYDFNALIIAEIKAMISNAKERN